MNHSTRPAVRASGSRLKAPLRAACVGLFLTCSAFAIKARAADTVRSEVDISTKDVGSKETAAGDLVADAIRSAAKADAAVIAASSFAEGVTISRGQTTSADLLKTLQSEDRADDVVIVKLTGDQITRALNYALYTYPRFNSGFLQTSGLVVTIDPAADKDRRVLSVKVGSATLEAGKTYRVAMPGPLAHGALAYFKIWKKADIDKETNTTIEDAVKAYLADHPTVSKGDERFVAKK